MSTAYVRTLPELGRDDIDEAGGKGANLGELTRAGLAVPAGFVVLTGAYRAFVEASGIGSLILEQAADSDDDTLDRRAAEIQQLFAGELPEALTAEISSAYAALGDDPAVAVRSSATAEDLPEASFAGQQDTLLNVRGSEAVLAAVRSCWASLWNARAMAYRARQSIDPAEVSLAVVVQEMVDADAAGVLFTANPTNGHRDEIVIGAAWGLGESVVSGAVDTDDLVLDKDTFAVLNRRTADKQVMTVYAAIGTLEQPVPEARRSLPVLSDEDAAELAREAVRIEAHFGAPQDIEWARQDHHFVILQARPVTALPEIEGPAPTDWTVSEPTAMYARASIVEQLPDPLTPLFAELIDGSVTRSLVKLMAEFMGSSIVRPGDVGLPTVNGYAYYRYSRAGIIRLTVRTPLALPVLASGGKRSGVTRWRTRSHPQYQRIVAGWRTRPIAELSDLELMDGVAELLDAGTEYYTSVQAVIPVAAASELFFAAFYDRLVRRHKDPAATTFLVGLDSEPLRAEKSLYDLAAWARTQPGLAEALLRGSAAQVLERSAASDDPLWTEWRRRLTEHLDRYGHAIYNLDFANEVPADHPEPLVETVRFYLRGLGTDPRIRQQGLADRREKATRTVTARLDPVRRAAFTRLLDHAHEVAPLREDALADVGLAWPQLRRMLLELGRRLVEAGVLTKPDEVFWLHRDEILGRTLGAAERIEQRKQLWRGQRRVTPPGLLPAGSWFEVMRGLMPTGSEDQEGDVIVGIGASAGVVTAPARVLGGPEDFGLLEPGDILVAGITTPAWTTLFARAGGVVTDVGGPLSHSSIVAREYGIPAVLGTAVATRRIKSGQRIRVDGTAGTVTLLDGEDTVGPEAATTQSAPPHRFPWGRVGVAALAAVAVVWEARRRLRRRTDRTR